MRASRVKSSSPGSLNFSYDSETAAGGSGSSPNFLYSAARKASRFRIESARRALSSIGLLFSAFCLAAFFWPESWVGGGLGLAGGVVALDRIARGVEHGCDLAAGGGEFGLGLGLAFDRRR